MAKAGLVDGRHFTTYIDEVRSLKRAADYPAAEALLLRCIAANEAESRSQEWCVAPGWYRELAIVYRKQGRLADEVTILERYKKEASRNGSFGGKLAERLVKVREKLDRAK